MSTPRLPRFAIVSGIGWLIDLGVMLSLVQFGLDAGRANILGASCGVTFVFFAAQQQIFRSAHGFRVRALALYAGCQIVAILAASGLVGLMASLLQPAATETAAWLSAWIATLSTALPPSPHFAAAAAAKAFVTPITLYANFLFMSWLLEGQASWR